MSDMTLLNGSFTCAKFPNPSDTAFLIFLYKKKNERTPKVYLISVLNPFCNAFVVSSLDLPSPEKLPFNFFIPAEIAELPIFLICATTFCKVEDRFCDVLFRFE